MKFLEKLEFWKFLKILKIFKNFWKINSKWRTFVVKQQPWFASLHCNMYTFPLINSFKMCRSIDAYLRRRFLKLYLHILFFAVSFLCCYFFLSALVVVFLALLLVLTCCLVFLLDFFSSCLLLFCSSCLLLLFLSSYLLELLRWSESSAESSPFILILRITNGSQIIRNGPMKLHYFRGLDQHRLTCTEILV